MAITVRKLARQVTTCAPGLRPVEAFEVLQVFQIWLGYRHHPPSVAHFEMQDTRTGWWFGT